MLHEFFYDSSLSPLASKPIVYCLFIVVEIIAIVTDKAEPFCWSVTES